MTASAAYAAIATLSFAFNFKFETFIEVPRLYSLIIPQNPRRNLYGPIFYSREFFMVLSISRFASLAAMSSRLSYSFLPLQSPTSIFTCEPEK